MPNQAIYRVGIPSNDQFGQPLHPRLPSAAHRWLRSVQPGLFKEGWVEGPHEGLEGPSNHVVTIAEDTPETDSYVKQLGSHIGQMTNHPSIFVNKEGGNGSEHWTIPNNSYRPAEGANPSYLAT